MSLTMNEFASRPVHAASAVRIALLGLGVIVSLAAGKALLEQGLATPAKAEPAVADKVAAGAQESAKKLCRQVEVEIDDAGGVRGRVVWICRKPL
ncbi:MAG: hypothetical protein C3F11_21785 [Methylocystaceae bacterium]|nr:MAG: hypothetical protein C3F11_21785 [Methylocystaceae bacterium]